MSKNFEKGNSYEDVNYVTKKRRKYNVLAFIICVLVAFVIWLYATNKENEKLAEEKEETVVVNNTEDSAASNV